MAYYQLEPWGEYQADRRAAVISSTMANIYRGKNKRPYTVDDFMPKYDRPKQDWKDIKDRFMRGFGVK